MTSWIRLTLPLTAVLSLACTPTPEEVATSSDVGSTGSTSGPVQLTTPGTTTPGEDTVGTQGATGMDTTMGAVDTTVGVSSVTEGTTTVGPMTSSSSSSTSSSGGSSGGESSSGGPPPPECMVDGDCESNEICDTGMCADACGGAWGAGMYGSCLGDLGGADCGGDLICISDGYPWTATTCSAQACATACDCPAPPVTGNAVVTCGSITMDAVNDCYLSCAMGETCPDGMECVLGFVCMAAVPASVPMYGNCDDISGVTCDGGTCGIAGNASVCSEGCPNAGACDAGPPGTMAPQCSNVFDPPAGNDCFLPCIDASDCPPGGQCVDVSGPTNACMF